MPNWVSNEVHMRNIGANKDLYNESGEFDFGAIIPMPESIAATTSGSITDIAIELVLYLANKRYEKYSNIQSRLFDEPPSDTQLISQNPDLQEKCENAIGWIMRDGAATPEDTLSVLIKTGVQYIYNLCMYSSPEWYDWCCRNWSTKWNASGTQIIGNDCVIFNTPWNIPHNVLAALSEMYPYDEIIVNWFEESGHCGVTSYHGGEKIQDDAYIVIWDTMYDYEKDEYKNRLFTVVEPE